MDNPGRFKAINFVVRWARLLPWFAALLVLAAGIAFGWFGSPGSGVGALVGAVLAWAVTRLAIEVVDLVAETLLPR